MAQRKPQIDPTLTGVTEIAAYEYDDYSTYLVDDPEMMREYIVLASQLAEDLRRSGVLSDEELDWVMSWPSRRGQQEWLTEDQDEVYRKTCPRRAAELLGILDTLSQARGLPPFRAQATPAQQRKAERWVTEHIWK